MGVCRQVVVIAEIDKAARAVIRATEQGRLRCLRVVQKRREMFVNVRRTEVGERARYGVSRMVHAGLKHEVVIGRSADRHRGRLGSRLRNGA